MSEELIEMTCKTYDEILLEKVLDENYYVTETFKPVDDYELRLIVNLVNLYNQKKIKWTDEFKAYKNSILNNQPITFNYLKSYMELNALKNLIAEII